MDQKNRGLKRMTIKELEMLAQALQAHRMRKETIRLAGQENTDGRQEEKKEPDG